MLRGTRSSISRLGSNKRSAGRDESQLPVLRRDYNFLEDSLHPDITFSRSSNATQTNSEGKICYAPNNLLPYSENFGHSDWLKINAATDTSTITDPFLGTGSYVYKETSTATNNKLLIDSHAVVNGGTYIFSVYAKAKELSILQLILGSVTYAGGNNHANFDLTNGVVTATGGGCVAKIEKIGTDGWYRCSIADTTSASGNTETVIGLYNSPTAGRASTYAGNGSDGIYIFGAMSEQTFDKNASPSAYLKSSGGAEYGARFDYKDGDKKGLLIEEGRTNLLTQSDTNTYVSAVSNTFDRLNNHSISPSGLKDAAKFISTAPNALKVIHPPATPVVGTSTTFTFSAYIKRGNTDFVRMYHNDSTSFGVTFNLATGQVHSNDATANGSHFIEEVGNDGWYRCGYSHTTPSGHSLGGPYIYPTDTNNTITHANQWSVILWQPQVELGSFPTSLVPTRGSTSTRAADIASVSGTAFSRFFKDTEGTIVVDVQMPTGWEDTEFNRFYTFSDGSFNNSIQAWINGNPTQEPRGQVKTGGVDQGSVVAKFIKLNTGEITRLGQVYKTNDHQVFIDGAVGSSDSIVSLPTVLNKLNIGSASTGSVLGGWIRRLRYFNKRKSNAQVQKLTDTSFLLDKFKGAKAAHSLRSLRDGRDNSPVTRIRREYDSFEADYTAAQVSNGDLEKDFRSADQTTLPLDVSVEADEMVTNGDFSNGITGWGNGGTTSDTIVLLSVLKDLLEQIIQHSFKQYP